MKFLRIAADTEGPQRLLNPANEFGMTPPDDDLDGGKSKFTLKLVWLEHFHRLGETIDERRRRSWKLIYAKIFATTHKYITIFVWEMIFFLMKVIKRREDVSKHIRALGRFPPDIPMNEISFSHRFSIEIVRAFAPAKLEIVRCLGIVPIRKLIEIERVS